MADSSIGLTIFLIREGSIAALEKAFPAQSPAVLALTGDLEGYFVPMPTGTSRPPWVTAVSGLLVDPEALNLTSQAAGGLLVIVRKRRTFVVSFGHAWLRLDDAWLEPDFGLKVALNLIESNRLIEIRVEQVFAKWHVASDRSPRATSVDEFGVEFDRDLVGSVEGVPSDKAMGKTVRGGTSVRLNLPIGQLPSILDKLEPLYKSTAYKKRWPDIDHLTPIRDADVIDQLEAVLDKELESGEAQKRLALFTPSFRRDESLAVDSYVLGRLTQTPPKNYYLTSDGWIDYLKAHDRAPSVAEAKGLAVHLLDRDGNESKTCTVYDCFGYEGALNGKQFVLSSGVWYQVGSEFVSRVNKAVASIGSKAIKLPSWNQVESEGEYNERCCENSSLLHFDSKNTHFGGGLSRFEFCDVFDPVSRSLLFVKIASKSSGMSHLVEQVRRTVELVFGSDEFRKELKKTFRTHHKKADTTWLDSRPKQGEWKLVLVSLGRPAKKLPFFAKCSLMKLDKDMKERGHDLSFIDV